MTLLKAPWLGPVLAENFALFQLFQVANPNLRHVCFTPVSHEPTGRMLEVFIIEKDTPRIVDYVSGTLTEKDPRKELCSSPSGDTFTFSYFFSGIKGMISLAIFATVMVCR